MSDPSVARFRGFVLADVIPRTWVSEASLVVAGAACVAALGQVSIPLGFTPVPVSLGTFAVLLVGVVLGPARALMSLSLFLAAGLAGAPVFAGHASTWHTATLGYVFGYIAAAVVVGGLIRRGAGRTAWGMAGVMAAGSVIVYAGGVPWLMVAAGMSFNQALAFGVMPFLIGDVVKSVAAAGTLPLARFCAQGRH